MNERFRDVVLGVLLALMVGWVLVEGRGVVLPVAASLIVAYVVPAGGEDEGAALTVADLDAHCRSHPMLADYKRPRAYRLVEALPMTATGKKMHFRVREAAIADETAGLLTRP